MLCKTTMRAAPGLTRGDPEPADEDEQAGPLTAVGESAIAYRGQENQDTVIFQISGATQPMGTRFGLDLSGSRVDNGTGTTAATDAFNRAAVAVSGVGSTTVSIGIYSDLSDALDRVRAIYSASDKTIIKVANSLSGKVTAMVDIADVSTSVQNGGPFRRFVDSPDDPDTMDAGILAKVEIAFDETGVDATTGRKVVGANLVKATNVKVTSAAGNFAIGTHNGGPIKDVEVGNRKVSTPNPWMVSSSKNCKSGPLKLGTDDGTYTGDLTRDRIEAATQAGGAAANKLGVNYFCVLVDGNTDPIPAVGNAETKDAYMLTLTPELVADRGASAPASIGPMAAGAISRNGTTVHLTYLTTNDLVDQRIVLVNRGSDAVHFWIEDGSFNLETGTTLATNNLGVTMGQMIPKEGRAVVKVAENIDFTGQDRGSATLNVAAPTRDIDVMTIQRSPFTDEVDTTLYGKADQ